MKTIGDAESGQVRQVDVRMAEGKVYRELDDKGKSILIIDISNHFGSTVKQIVV